MPIQWIGVAGGLGNRLIALGSILALAKSLETENQFPRSIDPASSSEYGDLFEEMKGIRVCDRHEGKGAPIGKARWEPMGIFTDFKRTLNHSISLEEYCHHFVESMRSLRFRQDILNEYHSHYGRASVSNTLAVHIRRTDMLDRHRLSLREYFSNDKRVKRRATHAFRALGMMKSIQYAVLSPEAIRTTENKYLARIIARELNADSRASYSIYVDSESEIDFFQQQLCRQGISDGRYFPSYCNVGQNSSWGTFGKRNTSTRDALIEILGMSASSGILQNMSASTFSICSSIMGGVPILTSQPTQWFWKSMQDVFGKPLYDVRTES
ncbi:MAG: hypothetical protein AAFX40_10950 [Cyanobacteria bacterium J06639_1]